ncbi:uncharacterized protein STEHIDRAFT_112966 [Stereum hirsutum FP-91666 SS1]|uniref:uncharacterized protein n=1 Tax=Stereum hirsutum (strain FP-91666) TaxID=721885 RepID=UPI0004449CDA|nr:uncharacterized protein STEHIDRAFT_112966 [Stereum hirsutum FP-91666 SS1]EIM84637.1 hypothetical protein STEHIDRAFT_112966 [Stereum hirsutum FP-91666 SS1]
MDPPDNFLGELCFPSPPKGPVSEEDNGRRYVLKPVMDMDAVLEAEELGTPPNVATDTPEALCVAFRKVREARRTVELEDEVEEDLDLGEDEGDGARLWVRESLELCGKVGNRLRRLRERGEAKIEGRDYEMPTKEEKRVEAFRWKVRTRWMRDWLVGAKQEIMEDEERSEELRPLWLGAYERCVIKRMDKAEEARVIRFVDAFPGRDEKDWPVENASTMDVAKHRLATVLGHEMLGLNEDGKWGKEKEKEIVERCRSAMTGWDAREVLQDEELGAKWSKVVGDGGVWDVLDSDDSTATELSEVDPEEGLEGGRHSEYGYPYSLQGLEWDEVFTLRETVRADGEKVEENVGEEVGSRKRKAQKRQGDEATGVMGRPRKGDVYDELGFRRGGSRSRRKRAKVVSAAEVVSQEYD